LLTIAALTTAMEYQSVPAYLQDIVTGVILLLLILLDRTVSSSQRRDVTLAALWRRAWASRQLKENERTNAP